MTIKKYEGVLERVGTGQFAQRGTAIKYDVVVIGGQELRGIATGGYLNSFLDVGKEATLYVGPLFFIKFIFAIKTDSGLKKANIGWLVLNGALKAVLTPILLLLGTALGTIGLLIMFGFVLFLWYRLVMNIVAYSSIS